MLLYGMRFGTPAAPERKSRAGYPTRRNNSNSVWMPRRQVDTPGALADTATHPYPLRTNMLYYSIKLVVTALLIVAISEVAKRHSGFAALLASLPLTSLLAFVWLHVESTPNEQLGLLSGQIFWLVLPSLLLFLALPLLLRAGVNFWLSMLLAMAATALCYLAMLSILKRYGITL